MEDKITIIEGPTPTFEAVPDGWAHGVSDGANLNGVVMTRLRTANGPALVERCYNAWKQQHPIHLEFRSPDGLHQQASIVAARNTRVDEGDMLFLWVRIPLDDMEVEFEYDEDDDDIDLDDDDLNMDIF